MSTLPSDSLAARVDRAIDEFPFYAGGERFESQGAVFVRNRSIPDKYYANHVEQVTASSPEEIARLSARIEVEFEGYRHRCFYVDRDTPTEFEAWLVMEGYQRTDSLVMVLTEELHGTPKPYEIGLGSVHTMRVGVIIGEWNSHKTSTNASLLSYQYSVEM